MAAKIDFPELEKAHPREILNWAVSTYQNNLVVVTSFQPTGIVALHMLQEIAPDICVMTLDTDLLFPETYSLIEKISKELELNLQYIQPELSLEEQANQYGTDLWKSEPDQCCNIRKVLPLKKTLLPYKAWITGLRRDQSPQRANVQVAEWDQQYQLIKISPFSNWTENMIWEYIKSYDLPYNELHDCGYPSIGCKPCTSPVSPENTNVRAGRWPRHDKAECGIHRDLAIAS